MSGEDQNVDVGALPKFDMPLYTSEMTAKDVKSLALRHDIPLDLHPVALTKEWTMDKLPEYMIGLYGQYFEFSGIRVPFSAFLLAVIKHFHLHISQVVPLGLNLLTMFELYCRSLGWKRRFFFLDMRAIPDAMAWRHHDSDVNDPIPEDGFNASDVQILTEQVVDLRLVPFGLLFLGGLATTWDFPGLRPVFKYTEGNVVTMSEYLRFPFLSGASISKGSALTSHDRIEQYTARPLPRGLSLRKKKKRRQGGDGGEGSRPKTKRRKIVARKDGPDASKATSSPKPIRTVNPTEPTKENPSGAVAATAESREDRSPPPSPHGSDNHFIHNYSDAQNDGEGTNILWLRAFGDQSGKADVLM
ncbi:hypothetical protein Tco_0772618 [Tanacetum coccineum]|uniref:Aminotransferase-like plant mobile domain-containing protein n=1 Tax=Tanacetum coccineum TaxID=301880 RepID=A0ABQ4ZM35_9ASTR